MTIRYHASARFELKEAVRRYNKVRKRLGQDFHAEVLKAEKRIIAHPIAWQPLSQGVRRCLLKRFPYGLVYAVVGDVIWILAVMHLHRRPDYWKDRVDDVELTERSDADD